MGAVEQAKSLVGQLLKQSEGRVQALENAIKSLEEMRDQLTSTFRGTASDTGKTAASALEASITEIKKAAQAVERSKSELAKCQSSL